MIKKEDEIIDKRKLTQRELLILLSEQMERMNADVSDFKKVFPQLSERVTKIETKMIMIAGSFSVLSILITIIINVFEFFN